MFYVNNWINFECIYIIVQVVLDEYRMRICNI
jgi:hypothetical protein